MIKKLSKFGNSKALIIDKPILELINIGEDTELEISTDGKSLLITPVKKKKRVGKISLDSSFQKIYKKNIKKYDSTLKKLAKN